MCDLVTQLEIEAYYKEKGEQALKKALQDSKEGGQGDNTQTGRNFIRHGLKCSREAIVEWLNKLVAHKAGVKPSYYPIAIDLLKIYGSAEDASNMLVLLSLASYVNVVAKGIEYVKLNDIAHTITNEVKAEANAVAFENWLKEPENKLIRKVYEEKLNERKGAYYRKYFIRKCRVDNNFTGYNWGDTELKQLVITVLDIIADGTGYYVIEGIPYLDTVLIPTERFNEAWTRNEDNIVNHAYCMCPTVIPPKPWTSQEEGGYYGVLSEYNKMIRLDNMQSSFVQDYIEKLNQLDITPITNALNSLQATAWTINKQVLDVLMYYHDTLERIPKHGEPNNYIIMGQTEKAPRVDKTKMTDAQFKQYKKKLAENHVKEFRRESLKKRATAMLFIARDFAKYEKIYFPHNLDFRGRLYPIPVFSPQGDDLSKSLLLFADTPKCETEDALKYMAITGANLAGVDKVSYNDRLNWVLSNEEAIMAVAVDPYSNNWWVDQDSPCQFLAWCFEWYKMRKYQADNNGSVIGWQTGIVYAQDGTCSGLQHYSAILRDPVGGTYVNLLPQDKPNDIYQRVADVVNVKLKKLADKGTLDELVEDENGKVWLKLGTKTMAQIWLSYGVNRKVTKQPVMTYAYGATKFGYTEQIMTNTISPALREQGSACVFVNKSKGKKLATFLASLILDAVKAVVKKASEAMDWLQECAKIVCDGANVVSWVTPIGYPVQQNYCKYQAEKVQLRCNKKLYRLYIPHSTGEINGPKQRNAVAPNFIHSMDATHLMMTINASVDAGIHHFAMVHDSYGCPIAQADKMYTIVREQFVKLYTEHDVLAEFKADMEELTDKQLPAIPAKGDLDINVVLDSKYIFC